MTKLFPLILACLLIAGCGQTAKQTETVTEYKDRTITENITVTRSVLVPPYSRDLGFIAAVDLPAENKKE
jgi:ABC-type Fe3+-hydroxamate transport system substrate-binding protein